MSLTHSVNQVLIPGPSQHCRAAFKTETKTETEDGHGGRRRRFSELVTQFIIPDKLRNLNHDIGGIVTDSQRVDVLYVHLLNQNLPIEF